MYIKFSLYVLAIAILIALGSQQSHARLLVRQNATATDPISVYAPLMNLPNSPRFSVEDFTKEIVIEDDVIRNVAQRLPLYRDRIVLSRNAFENLNGSIYEWMHVACQEAYAIVLPWGLWDTGLGFLEYGVPRDFKGSYCRAYTISVPSYNLIRALLPGTYEVGLASVAGDDGEPPVRTWLSSGWFFFLNIFLAASSCAVAALGATRLYDYFASYGDCKIRIATICIWLETLSALVRFLYWGVDPFSQRRLIPTAPLQSAFRTASFPLSISSTILLSFYWHESLSTTSLKVSMNLSRFRIPAYICCVLCFLVEILAWVVFVSDLQVGFFFRIINNIWYIIVVVFMAAFYITTAVRIFIALARRHSHSSAQGRGSTASEQSASSTRTKSDSHMKTVTMKLSVSAFALLLFVVVAPLSLAPFYNSAAQAHPGYLAFWWVAHSIFNLKSAAAILAFTPAGRGR